ncbi:MAG: ribokinase [Chitinophagaceae bacterium]|nr:ribokinase [Chitinophagaceae bacterium]
MSTPPYILVVGSSNTDMVINSPHLPAPGETIIGSSFFMNPGGKGANQAVAAARLGGNVTLICKTGNDIFGRQAAGIFENEGIDISYLVEDPDNPSGVALITVDDKAENTIVVASGSNATLSRADLEHSKNVIENASVVLMQLEIPLDTVQHVAEIARSRNVRVILNPAPACELDDAILKNISIITPNEKEAGMLTGVRVEDVESAKEAAKKLSRKGIGTVIITLGPKGALVYDGKNFEHVKTAEVKAVDTTAAGDIFNGALAVALNEGKELKEAAFFACKAAAISVTRKGAQSSAPYRKEIT